MCRGQVVRKHSHSRLIQRDGITFKSCTGCKDYRPIEEFSKSRAAKYGLSPKCKTCVRPRPITKHSLLRQDGETTLKSCTKCGEYKQLEEFDKNKAGKYGFNARCKTCIGRGPKRRAKLLKVGDATLKCCTVCGQPKPLDDYRPWKSGAMGVEGRCRACWAAHCRTDEYRQAKCARNKVWRQKSPDKARAADKRHRERHLDKRRAYNREYSRKLRAEQRDRVLADKRAYYQRNKEREYIRLLTWIKTNPDKAHMHSAKRRALMYSAYVEDVSRAIIYVRDKGICSLCGKHVKRADASIDHIIPLTKYGKHSYANIALAHRSCNTRKGNRAAVQQMRLF